MGRIVMELLIGKYAHVIDDKSRLTIPSKIRNKIGNVVYVSKGFEGCLEIRKPEEFEKYTKNLLTYRNTDPKMRMVTREIFSNTEEIEIDSAGRILLSNLLLQIGNLNKDVYIIGVVDHLEIWDRKSYEEYEKKNLPDFELVANELGKN